MILHDIPIRRLCKHDNLIEPFDEALLNGASYDVRIGDTAKLITEDGNWEVDLESTYKENAFILPPGSCLLVATWEKFNIPTDLAAVFYLKSSRAREFIEHMHATWIDPGYHNSVLTLELQNAHPSQAKRIYKGLRIGQIVFHRLEGKTTKSYSDVGSYNNASTVEASNKEHETSITSCSYNTPRVDPDKTLPYKTID